MFQRRANLTCSSENGMTFSGRPLLYRLKRRRDSARCGEPEYAVFDLLGNYYVLC